MIQPATADQRTLGPPGANPSQRPDPIFPVPLAGELCQIHRSDLLDGGFLVPVGELVLADRLYHPVKDAVQKIFADRRPLFPIRRGDNRVNDAAKVDIPVDLVSQPERSELFDFQFLNVRLCAAGETGDSFRRADVDLGNDLGLAIDAGDLTDIEVGSSFLGFNVEVSHADTIYSRVLHVK